MICGNNWKLQVGLGGISLPSILNGLGSLAVTSCVLTIELLHLAIQQYCLLVSPLFSFHVYVSVNMFDHHVFASSKNEH